ncbi:MAG: cation:proton antiporter [Parcubacteria group bacterium]|nr:cation:proton antiporter [Parcubacteria group bacterium]
MDAIFFQITALLVLTAAVAWVANWLKQPLIVAYILAGILAGPLAFNLVASEAIWRLFSQLGIILLLFLVGLSLNFGYLKKIGTVSLVTGIGQVAFTALFGVVILRALDFGLLPALYLAVAITFSSTIIITKLLSDKKQIDSLYGRYTIGLMLVQDVIAIVLLIALSSAGGGGSAVADLASLGMKGLALFGLVVALSRFVLPGILRHVSRSTEFLFLFALAWCFAVTAAAYALGFSMEIGAVVAGLALGSSAYQAEISARIKPVRDFFLIMFFITLGSEMAFGDAAAVLVPAGALSLFILIGNPFILYMLYRAFKFTRRNSFLSGVTAAQVSEFGFVLLVVGRELGAVGTYEINVFTVVALVTIFVSSYLITYSERIFTMVSPVLALFGSDRRRQKEPAKSEHDVWVIGYHRIGWKIVHMLKSERHPSFAVVDYNPEIIDELKEERIPAYFGDVADVELLSDLALAAGKLIISTIPDAEDQLTLIRYVRERSPKPVLVANCPDIKRREALYAAGADYVLTPHLLGGDMIADMLRKGADRADFKKMKERQDREIAGGLPVYNL